MTHASRPSRVSSENESTPSGAAWLPGAPLGVALFESIHQCAISGCYPSFAHLTRPSELPPAGELPFPGHVRGLPRIEPVTRLARVVAHPTLPESSSPGFPDLRTAGRPAVRPRGRRSDLSRVAPRLRHSPTRTANRRVRLSDASPGSGCPVPAPYLTSVAGCPASWCGPPCARSMVALDRVAAARCPREISLDEDGRMPSARPSFRLLRGWPDHSVHLLAVGVTSRCGDFDSHITAGQGVFFYPQGYPPRFRRRPQNNRVVHPVSTPRPQVRPQETALGDEHGLALGLVALLTTGR